MFKKGKKSKSSRPRESNALVMSCDLSLNRAYVKSCKVDLVGLELLFGTDSKLFFGDVKSSRSVISTGKSLGAAYDSIEVKPVEDDISLLITLKRASVIDWPISTVHPIKPIQNFETSVQLYYGSRKGKERMAFLHLPSSLALKTTCRSALTPVPVTASSRPTQNSAKFPNWVLDFRSKSLNFAFSGALALGLSLSGKCETSKLVGVGVADAKVGVNKPELLPKEFTTVIDVAGFLSDGQMSYICGIFLNGNMINQLVYHALWIPETHCLTMVFPFHFGGQGACVDSLLSIDMKVFEMLLSQQRYLFGLPELGRMHFARDGLMIQEKRLAEEISDIEKDTGFKLRVLAQNYPDTPGLAIKDFWQVDDRTVVFVADPNFGNILNFNVGASVDLDIPRSFWSRLAGKYGNMFYWKEKGEDASIEAAVMAISSCLREPAGPNNCSEVK
ncbi:hypothetical protein DKX38_024193 [Salix brachista]|uniref:TPM domain-containing protein n=1 Tax=Salix brachista TaxID=2182728 RepID=A0A5N5JPJ9_9ROSI|nr:hypothetical protein DKX38_024193 [Salix brachista]